MASVFGAVEGNYIMCRVPFPDAERDQHLATHGTGELLAMAADCPETALPSSTLGGVDVARRG